MADNTKIYHGIKLADNAKLYNLEVEEFDVDPNPVRIGRIWFNKPNKHFKYTTLDDNDNLIIRTFCTLEDIPAVVLDANNINYAGSINNQYVNLPLNSPLEDTLNSLITHINKIYNKLLNSNAIEYFYTNNTTPIRVLTLCNGVTNKENLIVLINGLEQNSSAYNLLTTNSIEFVADLPLDSVIKIINTGSLEISPDQFNFTPVTNGIPNTVYTSDTITVTGLTPNTLTTIVACCNGQIDAGPTALSGIFSITKSIYTSSTGTFVLAARGTSPDTNTETTGVTVRCNGIYSTFSISNISIPNQFSFTPTVNADPNVPYSSEPVTVTGLVPNEYVTVSVANGLVDAGTTVLSGIFEASKTVMATSSGTIVLVAQGISAPII